MKSFYFKKDGVEKKIPQSTKEYIDMKVAGSDGDDINLSEYAKTSDLTQYAKTADLPTVPTEVSAFTNDAGYLTEQSLETKQDKIEDLEDYVKLEESANGRKHIVLKNHDSILGYGSANNVDGSGDLSNGTYTLGMISKWNVADFGSPSLHFGVNTLKDVDVSIKGNVEGDYTDFLAAHTEYCKPNDAKTLRLLKTIKSLTDTISALDARISALENPTQE